MPNWLGSLSLHGLLFHYFILRVKLVRTESLRPVSIKQAKMFGTFALWVAPSKHFHIGNRYRAFCNSGLLNI